MYIMQTDKSNFPRLFYHSAIEWKDDTEEKFERARGVLTRIVGNGSERQAHDDLTSAACRDHKTHDDICLGLLATILTEPTAAAKCFRDLGFLSRDNMTVVVENLVLIALDKYLKLTDVSRPQLIWVVREMVRTGVNGADMLCWNLMRQIAGGDISNRNLWLAENMLDIYSDNRSWLEKHPFLITSVIYTYLRILEDHINPQLASLKQKEVNFLVSLIRDHFTDCCMNPTLGMGRDFVRLLQNVSRIPEMQLIWKDIFYNPKALSPHLTGVNQLLNVRTSRKYFQSRLTPEMEKKIHFLTSNVRFGMQKRYQDWIQRQYLGTPESQSLRADMIRFIVGVIHPPNEILSSDILPRWAVIGWLLTTCTHAVAAANAKLALFYDWLVFDPNKDNIMNIEPGILVMYHSLRPHLAITATLLDFLIRLIQEYWPSGVEKIKDGVGAALRTILDKKVLSSLEPLLENPKLEPDLRTSIQDNLIVLLDRNRGDNPENNSSNNSSSVLMSDNLLGVIGGNGNGSSSPLHSSESLTLTLNANPVLSNVPPLSSIATSSPTSPVPPSPTSPFNIITQLNSSSIILPNPNSPVVLAGVGGASAPPPPPTTQLLNSNLNSSDRTEQNSITFAQGEPDFSDEDEDDERVEDVPGSSVPTGAVPMRNSPTLGTSVEEAERSKIFELVQTLPPNLRIPVESMLNDGSSDSRNEFLEEILEELTDHTIDKEQREALSKSLMYIYKSELTKPCINDETNSVVDPFTITPVSEIVNQLLMLKPSDKSAKSKNLSRMLTDFINQDSTVPFKILIALSQWFECDEDGPAAKPDYYPLFYKNLCTSRNLKLEQALNQDLKSCWEAEPMVVGYLCPFIYDWYESEVLGSAEILRLVVSTIDSFQLQDIVWKIAQQDFIVVDDSYLIPILTKSLDWETWEQHCVWTLMAAHQFSVDDYLPIIPALDFKNNAEALTALLLMLKNEMPSDKILGPCLCRRPNAKDRFVISLLMTWSGSYEEKVAEVLGTLLVRASGSPVKRKRGVATGGRGTSSPAGPAAPSVDNVLAHLDILRDHVQGCGVFSKDSMQAALLQVQSWVNDTQRYKYKELLALAASEEATDMKESRSSSKRTCSARKIPSSPTPTASGSTNSNSSGLSRTRSGRTRQILKDDSDESSEDDDEVVSRPRNAKKRRKTAVNSDSD